MEKVDSQGGNCSALLKGVQNNFPRRSPLKKDTFKSEKSVFRSLKFIWLSFTFQLCFRSEVVWLELCDKPKDVPQLLENFNGNAQNRAASNA